MGDMAFDSHQHIAQALNIQKSRRRIVARRLQQDVVRLVAAQHVVDQIGGDRDLPSGLFLARMALLDKTGNHGAIAEGALEHKTFVEPGFQIVAQHVLVEEVRKRRALDGERITEVVQRPDGERIVGRDEAERAAAGALQPAGEQHAKRLVGEAAFEGIGDHVVAAAAWKGFDQQFFALRQGGDIALQGEPVAHLFGQRAPALRIIQHRAHLIGEIGGERELAAGIGRHLRIEREGLADEAFVLADAFETQHLAGKQEGIAGRQHFEEIFLDLAERGPAAADGTLRAALDHAHVQHRHFDDGAEIEAVLLGDTRIGDTPQAVRRLADTGVALIGLQCITAGRDELHDAAELFTREIGIG